MIPEPSTLIGDLLSMDIGGSAPAAPAAPVPDLLGGGLDLLGGGLTTANPAEPPLANATLGDIFGIGGSTHTGYVPPKQVWLSADKGKGLEVMGTWSRRNGIINMEMTFTNRAMQAMTGFGIQLNKNRYVFYIQAPSGMY